MNSQQLREERAVRTEWLMKDRFGMFIHWGLYAIPSKGEWGKSKQKLSNEQYDKYFEEFNPTAYDPVEWARLAKRAGMKYAVMTAKHHDGFCLFDSALTEYKSTHTQAKRDLVREFVDAFRAEGLKVGLYYSLIDWHHPDYPAYGDEYHPMRDNPNYNRDPSTFSSYLTYMHGQIRELLTNYGKLDMMWFDFSYGQMTGEKWEATKLIRMIRELQPGIVVDNRLEAEGEGNLGIRSAYLREYAGDFDSPEQSIPPDGIRDENGEEVPWEACITHNNNWGYVSADRNWKTATTIIRKLVECVSKNGNLLLNIGPQANGLIPEASVRVLLEVGEWMSRNGESIYDCRRADLPKPEWGRFTRKGNKLYAHVLEQNIGALYIRGLDLKVKAARLLADGTELFLEVKRNHREPVPVSVFNFAWPMHYTFPLPDERNTVVELTLEE